MASEESRNSGESNAINPRTDADEAQVLNSRLPYVPYLTATATILGAAIAVAALLLFAIQWSVNSIVSRTQGTVQDFESRVQALMNDAEHLVMKAVDEAISREIRLNQLTPRSTAAPERTNQADQTRTDSRQDAPTVQPAELTQEIDLLPTHDFSKVVRGHTVTVRASIETDDEVYIVADTLDMSRGGSIHAPNITVFAKQLTGGRFDVSGRDGLVATEDARDGTNAGSITIAAISATDIQLVATGGMGENGSDGDRGSRGRRGNCDGFGEWRAARRGGDGEPGQNGGSGGDGGDITVWYSDILRVQQYDVAGGGEGSGGRGGPGGRGGSGCIGLGGAQEAAGNGTAGLNGRPGTPGSAGVYRVQEVSGNLLMREFTRVAAAPAIETVDYAVYCLRASCPE